MPKVLFEAFLTNGKVKYDALIRNPKNATGEKRAYEIKKALKNPLDGHFASLHKFGPACVSQGIKFFRYEKSVEEKHKDEDDFDSWVIDFKYTDTIALRSLYTDINYENNHPKKSQEAIDRDEIWEMVTRIEIVDQREEGKDILCEPTIGDNVKLQGRFFLIEGGTPTFRQAIMDLMKKRYDPNVTSTQKKPPSKSERKDIKKATQSGLGQALCNYHEDRSTEETTGKFLKESKSRKGWEEWALQMESVFTALKESAEGSKPKVKDLIKAITVYTAPKKAAEDVKAAIKALNK
jgi:hypothetical protein